MGLPAEHRCSEIYAEVFRRLRPRTPLPRIQVEFRRYANANAQVRYSAQRPSRDPALTPIPDSPPRRAALCADSVEAAQRSSMEPGGVLLVRLADTLEGAPEDVLEALAEILLCKLFRRPAPAGSGDRYRRYLNRRDVRRSLDLVREIRGRKRIEPPRGRCFDLEPIFEDLNFRYFFGLMARPRIGWSPLASRTMLGHYDPSHNAIVLSRILDSPKVPKLAVEYVLFHEMLHLRYPAEHIAGRRCVHTKAFKEAEKQFENLKEAKAVLRRSI